MYVLLLFYVLAGETMVEEIPQPSLATCQAERVLWLRDAAKTWVDPAAYCVWNEKLTPPDPRKKQ